MPPCHSRTRKLAMNSDLAARFVSVTSCAFYQPLLLLGDLRSVQNWAQNSGVMNKALRDETAPSWLNEMFMEVVLKKSFKNDDLKILQSEMKIATSVNENYASQLFRFELTIKTKKDETRERLSVIVKLVSPGRLGEEMEKMEGYEKERLAFVEVLPAINGLLEEAYPDHRKLWPDCYYNEKRPNYILVLEDLRERGFVLASRFEGLDREHSVLVLKSLAKFHAASLVWKARSPEKSDPYRRHCFKMESSQLISNSLLTAFSIMSKDILEWPEFDKREIYSEKLKNIGDNGLEKIFEVWKVDESKLNVLLHGDMWANNLLFRYDPNGKLREMNFVDFQMMSVNSPALDLQHFIFTSVNCDLKFDQVDSFLQIYHEAFEDTLKRLGHRLDKPYGLEQLKKDFEERHFWGLLVFCVVYPIFVLPPDEAFHPDDLLKGEASGNYEKAYKREGLRNTLLRGFRYFEEKGVL